MVWMWDNFRARGTKILVRSREEDKWETRKEKEKEKEKEKK